MSSDCAKFERSGPNNMREVTNTRLHSNRWALSEAIVTLCSEISNVSLIPAFLQVHLSCLVTVPSSKEIGAVQKEELHTEDSV